MRNSGLLLFIFLCFNAFSQDKIYLLNGECYKGKVTEVQTESIKIKNSERSVIYKDEILLIEYSNGLIENYKAPQADVVYSQPGAENKIDMQVLNDLKRSRLSINTLALTNADLSCFYEYLTRDKSVGFGAMGAYNFNRYANAQNAFIAILNNSKKNYDLGAYINFYTDRKESKSSFYYGVLFKYTDFTFSQLSDSSNVVKFTTRKGSQLATILTIGSHVNLTNDLFIKTLFGLGGFNMKGAYKEEFNRIIDAGISYTFMFKLYFGINIGFNL
jgi:sRNA-binding regulator protein Hfq